MPIAVILTAGTLGTLLGPQLRAIIFTHTVPSDSPPRHCCPVCGTMILPRGPAHLVTGLPFSGRCPACRDRIGPPLGIIEISTGAMFAALSLRFTSLPLTIGLCWLAACGVALAVIDATVQRLPNVLLGFSLIGLLVALVVAALADHQPASLLNAVLGGLTLFVGYTSLAMISGGMGFGDCKLAAVTGTALGWFSWTTLLTGTVLTFLFGALHLLAMRVRAQASGTTHIPFGPALLIGTFAAVLVAA